MVHWQLVWMGLALTAMPYGWRDRVFMSGEDRARCVRSDPPLGAVSIIRCSMDGRERIGDAASGLLPIGGLVCIYPIT